MAEDKPRCETCRYWDNEGAGYFRGDTSGLTHSTCHRYPPPSGTNPEDVDENWTGRFPITLNVDWCGEWQARFPAESGSVSCKTVPIPGLEWVTCDTSIFDLFSARKEIKNLGHIALIRSAAQKLKVDTVGQFSQFSADDLYELRNFGAKSIESLRKLMAHVGMRFRS